MLDCDFKHTCQLKMDIATQYGSIIQCQTADICIRVLRDLFYSNMKKSQYLNQWSLLKSFNRSMTLKTNDSIQLAYIFTNYKWQLVHYFNYNIRYLEEVNPEEAYESNLASNPPTCASISFKETRNGNFCSNVTSIQNQCKNPARRFVLLALTLDSYTTLEELEKIKSILIKLVEPCDYKSADQTEKVTIIQLSNLLKIYECYLPKCRDRINSIKHVVPNNFDNPDIIFDLMSEFVYEFMYDTFELYLFSNHIDCGEAFNKMFNDMNKIKEKLQFYVGNINVTFKWININRFANKICYPPMESSIFEFYNVSLLENGNKTDDTPNLLLCQRMPKDPASYVSSSPKPVSRTRTDHSNSFFSTTTNSNDVDINTVFGVGEKEAGVIGLYWLFILMPLLLIFLILCKIFCPSKYTEKLTRLFIKKKNHHLNKQTNFARECEISSSHVEIIRAEKLGEGAFSQVYKGRIAIKGLLKTIFKSEEIEKNSHIEVAIKIFRKEVSRVQTIMSDPWCEIHLIKQIKYHPYIVNMIGWAMMPFDGPCLLLEYCSNGNLHKFLQRLRPLIREDELPTSPHENCLGLKDLIIRAWQISDAMVYLTENGFIHRDLAARNILLTDKMVAKVADFGLCRNTPEAPYVGKRSTVLPLRWLAIEALRSLQFTEKTDVWSFGVLLYEIFSIGLKPYEAIEISRGKTFDQKELLEYLQEGGRLERPRLCPEDIYILMLSCWEKSLKLRSNFKQIRDKLSSMLEVPEETYGYVEVLDDSSLKSEYTAMWKF
uniref:Protein kinase domain-containing protein n=1 Tax=Acrobeloides nanus TaxID=290746 RepID=A0A914D8D4_9BILA